MIGQRTFYLALGCLAILAALTLAGGVGRAALAAQTPPPPPPLPDAPPYRLPFNGPPGPDTWTVAQWYGNTELAYHYRDRWYEAGQGLHFGLDFAALCGTEIVAVSGGIVARIDEPNHGAGPHNLIINHGDGFAALYGHLLERAPLEIGQRVERGQVVGLSGDPDETCRSRPHLHLEIRNDTYHYAFNPVQMIAADWDALALFGPRGSFQRDLENPRRWLTPYDQPAVDFWEPMLNNYWNPWPPDWSQ